MRIVTPGKPVSKRERPVGGAPLGLCQPRLHGPKTFFRSLFLADDLSSTIRLVKVLCDGNARIACREASPESHLIGRGKLVEKWVLQGRYEKGLTFLGKPFLTGFPTQANRLLTGFELILSRA